MKHGLKHGITDTKALRWIEAWIETRFISYGITDTGTFRWTVKTWIEEIEASWQPRGRGIVLFLSAIVMVMEGRETEEMATKAGFSIDS